MLEYLDEMDIGYVVDNDFGVGLFQSPTRTGGWLDVIARRYSLLATFEVPGESPDILILAKERQ